MAPLVTDAGLAIITNRIIGAGTEPKFVATGTGATAEAVGQTALVTEVETRTTGTSSRTTTTKTNDTYHVVGTITATAARALTEGGLFDASTVGNMLARGVHSSIGLA